MTGFSGRAETKALIHQSTLQLQVLAEVRRYLVHDRFLLKILARGGYGWGRCRRVSVGATKVF